MSTLNQEHIATLRQEIPMITRQIQLISGPEFANTVPEVAAAKQAQPFQYYSEKPLTKHSM